MKFYISLLFMTILLFGCHSKSEDTLGEEQTNRHGGHLRYRSCDLWDRADLGEKRVQY
jgi:hypothetical protein